MSSSLNRYKLALASAALAVVANGALAQTQQAFSLGDAATKSALNAPAEKIDDSNLRRIGADAKDMFFNGERASNEYPFYALPAEIAGTTKLVLTLQTSISAAPETSSMRVFVNDQDVGTVKLRAGDPYRVEFKVPNGVIQPGYNAISILVDQKHRVDCSIDATYELWTQIDPSRSGLIFADGAKSSGNSIPDIIALSGISDGRTPIRGYVTPGATGTDYNRTMAALQSLAIIGSFDRPSVSIGQKRTDAPGINVVVGTRGTVSDIIGQADASALKDGVNVLTSADGKQKTLVVTGRTASEVDAAVEILKTDAEKHQYDGTPQGLRALANAKGRLLQPQSTVPLRNLGLITEPFSGRLYKEQINFSMPSDFYPGDYGSLVLHLSAQYAANLSRDAELMVRANNEVVSDITLGASRNGLIDDQRLPIPLSKLRPGENTIQLEARLPVPSDVACDPVARGGEDRSRLLILGKSFLEVPEFARVGRYPDIAALVSGATFNNRDDTGPVAIYVPGLANGALDAAGSFLAKMAYSSGHVLPVDVTTAVPDARQGKVIAFGAFSDLPEDISGAVGLDLSTRITSLPVSLQKSGGTQVAASSLAVSNTAFTAGDAQASDTASSGTFDPRQKLNALFEQASLSASGVVTEAKDYASSTISRLRFGATDLMQSSDARYQPDVNTALLIAQKEVQSGGVWTVIASPSSASLTASVDTIMDRTTWTQLNGSVQSFTATGQVIDQVAPTRVSLFATQATTIGNLRLIVAGWFANHVIEYTLAQIGAAILLGASTFLLLKLGRPR